MRGATACLCPFALLPASNVSHHTHFSQLAKVHRNKPPQTWIAQFRKYLASIPPYYYPVLRNTMRSKFGAAVRSWAWLIAEAFSSFFQI